MSTKFPGQNRYSRIRAGERHHLGQLAKVGVAGSNPVVRSDSGPADLGFSRFRVSREFRSCP